MTTSAGHSRTGTVAIVAEHSDLSEVRARVEQGGARKYHETAAAAGKLFARERPI